MIFVNFKTYEEGSGAKALELVKIIEGVSGATQVKIVPVVQALDAEAVLREVKIEVWVQHIDPISYGAHTGWTLPEEVSKLGIKGVFLNHSEHKFPNFTELSAALTKCKEVDLKTLIFAASLEELEQISSLNPTFVSYEPPEFIGKTDISVAGAQPEIISKASEIAKKHSLPLIVGAGIHDRSDVVKSRELGAVGIAVATDVVKAADPKKELLDLVSGFE